MKGKTAELPSIPKIEGKKPYRPGGWGNIKKSVLEEPNGMGKYCCSVCGDEISEAIATAMLEGLKKEPFLLIEGQRYKVISIPEE